MVKQRLREYLTREGGHHVRQFTEAKMTNNDGILKTRISSCQTLPRHL